LGNATVSIVVPASGLGPVSSAADLVGEKTVQLSGTFEGSYDLLASQDDLTFVPIVSFSTGDPEGLKQTVSGAFKSFRLRNVSATPLTAVACEVTAVSAPGENDFATVASLGAGFTGLTPIVDTWALFPPTGIEEEVCFLCRGGFRGPVVVLGSMDGTRFNPIGTFRIDALPDNAPAVLELGPLSTPNNVRYLRLDVVNIITAPTVVTVGGRVPSSSPGPTTSTLAETYAAGAAAADQTMVLLDSKGGTVVVDGTSPSFTGAYAFAVEGSEQITGSLAVGVVTATARIHAAAGTAAVGTSPLKIPSGVVLTVPEPGAVEADASHLYWTNAAGARLQLDNPAFAVLTLAQAYAAGSVAADQTLALLDAKGGGLVVDGTSASFTGAYALTVKGSEQVTKSLAVGVVTATARVHAAAGTATAGTAPLKVPSGVVLTTPEPGAVEADASHLYWTSAAGARLQLDNSAPVVPTLAQAYAAGSVAADQTLALLDAKGGGLVVDGTSVSFTGAYALTVKGSEQVTGSIAAGVVTATARVHAAAGTAAAGTAPLKVPSGVVLTVPEPGAVEADASHLYWTNATGARLQLDDAAPVTPTLAQSYAAGSVAADQTLALLDAKGGGLVVDGTSVSFTGAYALTVKGSEQVTGSIAAGVVTATARVHAAAGTAAAGTAPLKVPSGVVLTVPEPGAVEADASHLYWTNAAGARLQLDDAAPVTPTLAQSYAAGSVAADQTLALLDAKGGGLVVDGTSVSFTGAYALTVKGSEQVTGSIAAGVVTATARVHAAAGTAAAGTAPLKVPSGVVLTVPEPGAVEADASHLYWTNAAGARLQLDDAAPVTPTLAQSYAAGSVAADQTLALLDAKGGGLVVDGTSPSFTGAYALAVRGNSFLGGTISGVTTDITGTATVELAISVPDSGGADADGGGLDLYAGNGGSGGTGNHDGGSISINPGSASGSGNNGKVTIEGDAQILGNLNLSGDLTGVFHIYGSATLGFTIENPSAGTYDIDGASITLRSGDAGSGGTGNHNGGSVYLTPGAGHGTGHAGSIIAQGSVQIGGTLTGVTSAITGTKATALTISVPTRGTDDGDGVGITIAGDAGGSGGTGNHAGGNITLTPGAGHGSGAAGNIVLAGTSFTSTQFTALGTLSGAGTTGSGAIVLANGPAFTAGFTMAGTIVGVTTAITGTKNNLLTISVPTQGTADADGVGIIIASDAGGSGGAGNHTGGSVTVNLGAGHGSGVPGSLTVNSTVAPTSGSTPYTECTFAYTINQTGGANGTVTGIMVSATETALVGSHYLLDMQLGAAERFRVDRVGVVSLVNGTVAAPSLSFFSDAATGIYHTGTGSTGKLGIIANGGTVLAANQYGVGISRSNSGSSGTVPTIGHVFTVDPGETLNASPSLSWQGFYVVGSTLQLTGSSNPTNLRMAEFDSPNISAANTCVIADYSNVLIRAATFDTLASATRNWALDVQGNTRLAGGQAINATYVNSAGPYTVLDTDYALEVHYTATGSISINLPAISGMAAGNPRVLISIDSGYNCAANNITLVRSGSDKINNVAANYVQNVNGSAIWLKANTTTSNWEIL